MLTFKIKVLAGSVSPKAFLLAIQMVAFSLSSHGLSRPIGLGPQWIDLGHMTSFDFTSVKALFSNSVTLRVWPSTYECWGDTVWPWPRSCHNAWHNPQQRWKGNWLRLSLWLSMPTTSTPGHAAQKWPCLNQWGLTCYASEWGIMHHEKRIL